jgi:hypothetical protein
MIRATTATILLLTSIWCLPARAGNLRALSEEQDQTAQTAQTTQAAPAPPPSAAGSDNDWHFKVTPYLWFAGVSGTTGVFDHNVGMHLSAGDLLSHFRIGLMGYVEARKNRFVLPLDVFWIKLRADKATPFDPGVSNVQLDINEFMLTPEAGYRVVDKEKLKVDALAGFRYWHIGPSITFQPSGILGNISQSANWVDALGAAKIEMPLTEKVGITILGDAGGGGANSDYQVVGALGYKLKKVTLQTGWRYIDVNYRGGPPKLFVYDAHLSGLIAGVTFNLK